MTGGLELIGHLDWSLRAPLFDVRMGYVGKESGHATIIAALGGNVGDRRPVNHPAARRVAG
jgi:hypothetical protein